MNNPLSESKITIKRKIFDKKSNHQFTWKDIKHLILEDDDILNFYFVEGHSSENNSWDGFHKAEIYRAVEETDEEYKSRIDKKREWQETQKQNRYQKYLELKKEFENEK